MRAEDVTRPMVKAFQAKYRKFWKGSWPDYETSCELIASAISAAEEGSKAFRSTLEASLQSGSAGEVIGWEWQASDNQWVRGKDDSDRQMRQYEGRTIRNLFATPAKVAGGEPVAIRTKISEETKAALLAIDDNIRAAAMQASTIFVASPSPDGERQHPTVQTARMRELKNIRKAFVYATNRSKEGRPIELSSGVKKALLELIDVAISDGHHQSEG